MREPANFYINIYGEPQTKSLVENGAYGWDGELYAQPGIMHGRA